MNITCEMKVQISRVYLIEQFSHLLLSKHPSFFDQSRQIPLGAKLGDDIAVVDCIICVFKAKQMLMFNFLEAFDLSSKHDFGGLISKRAQIDNLYSDLLSLLIKDIPVMSFSPL
jgi:hypothetical protein